MLVDPKAPKVTTRRGRIEDLLLWLAGTRSGLIRNELRERFARLEDPTITLLHRLVEELWLTNSKRTTDDSV